MKKDQHKTQVIFRKVKKSGEIEAFFPYEIADHHGNVTCYAHVGQHSAASWEYFLSNTVPATKKEYRDLQRELSGLGYNLDIIKRRSFKKYQTAYINILR